MKSMKSYKLSHNSVAAQPLERSERRVLAYGPDLMLVEMKFEEGAIGAVHSHPHTQCTYIVSGKFVFTCEGEPLTVEAGDTIYFAPNEEHGATCLEAGTVVDAFSPQRDDFL